MTNFPAAHFPLSAVQIEAAKQKKAGALRGSVFRLPRAQRGALIGCSRAAPPRNNAAVRESSSCSSVASMPLSGCTYALTRLNRTADVDALYTIAFMTIISTAAQWHHHRHRLHHHHHHLLHRVSRSLRSAVAPRPLWDEPQPAGCSPTIGIR